MPKMKDLLYQAVAEPLETIRVNWKKNQPPGNSPSEKDKNIAMTLKKLQSTLQVVYRLEEKKDNLPTFAALMKSADQDADGQGKQDQAERK